MSELDKCLNEIFEQIIHEFPDDTFEKLKNLSKDDLWQAHFGFGTWLKGTFLMYDPETRAIFERHGIGQIDDMSSFIIEKFQNYLNEAEVED